MRLLHDDAVEQYSAINVLPRSQCESELTVPDWRVEVFPQLFAD